LLAGTDRQYGNSGANTLILWEGIQFAATVSQVFDFEGSMINGIENFMRQFGAQPHVYYEVRRLGIFKEFAMVMKPRIKHIIGYK
jgi:hypothetical protein